MVEGRTYVCIDLKSFYASVECVDRGLDPLTANLVVADPDRTEKTICLAITPSMKALGLPGRCRVFEIPEGVRYVMARPRMQRYMEVSADIYSIYQMCIRDRDGAARAVPDSGGHRGPRTAQAAGEVHELVRGAGGVLEAGGVERAGLSDRSCAGVR